MSETRQPRYLAYCRAHGRTPDEQMAADDGIWPGGVMAGFILWIGEQWRQWRAETGHQGPPGDKEHAAFDGWLTDGSRLRAGKERRD